MGKTTLRPISSLFSTNLRAPVCLGLPYPPHIHGAVKVGSKITTQILSSTEFQLRLKLKRGKKKKNIVITIINLFTLSRLKERRMRDSDMLESWTSYMDHQIFTFYSDLHKNLFNTTCGPLSHKNSPLLNFNLLFLIL